MQPLDLIQAYLDEKAIHHTIQQLRYDKYLIHLFDLSKKMFRDVVFPALKNMADIQATWERYGKTTGVRVIISIKVKHSPYKVKYFGGPSYSLPTTYTTTIGDIKLSRRKRSR